MSVFPPALVKGLRTCICEPGEPDRQHFDPLSLRLFSLKGSLGNGAGGGQEHVDVLVSWREVDGLQQGNTGFLQPIPPMSQIQNTTSVRTASRIYNIFSSTEQGHDSTSPSLSSGLESLLPSWLVNTSAM